MSINIVPSPHTSSLLAIFRTNVHQRKLYGTSGDGNASDPETSPSDYLTLWEELSAIAVTSPPGSSLWSCYFVHLFTSDGPLACGCGRYCGPNGPSTCRPTWCRPYILLRSAIHTFQVSTSFIYFQTLVNALQCSSLERTSGRLRPPPLSSGMANRSLGQSWPGPMTRRTVSLAFLITVATSTQRRCRRLSTPQPTRGSGRQRPPPTFFWTSSRRSLLKTTFDKAYPSATCRSPRSQGARSTPISGNLLRHGPHLGGQSWSRHASKLLYRDSQHNSLVRPSLRNTAVFGKQEHGSMELGYSL